MQHLVRHPVVDFLGKEASAWLVQAVREYYPEELACHAELMILPESRYRIHRSVLTEGRWNLIGQAEIDRATHRAAPAQEE